MALVLPDRREGDLLVPPQDGGFTGVKPYRFENGRLAGTDFYNFEHFKITRDNKIGLLLRAWIIHKELYLDSEREFKELKDHFREGGEAVFVTTRNDNPQDIGYVEQRLREVNIGGDLTRVLTIGAKVVSSGGAGVFPEGPKNEAIGSQGRGIGRALATDAVLYYQPDAVSGRTPNPYAILSYYRTGLIKEIYPIDRLIPPDQRDILAVLLDRMGVLNETDIRTGLCNGAYPPGESRLFVLNPDNADAVRIYNAMTNPPVGANLNAGDGVRYWARTDERKISRYHLETLTLASSGLWVPDSAPVAIQEPVFSR